MALAVPPSLEVLKSIIAEANALRYASAGALTILIWDHLVMMKEEYSSIWSRPVSLLKVIYVLQRYGETAALLLVAYAESGMSRGLDTQFCHRFLITEGVFGVMMLAITNFVVMTRVYALWDHRKNVLRALYAGFVITYIGVFVMGFLSWREMVGVMTWDGLLTFSCAVQRKSKFYKWIWVFQLVFDTFMILLAFVNASHRPRKLGVKLLDSLKRDGAAVLVALFVFRLTNLVLCILPNIAYMFSTVFIVWALNTVTLLRLIMRIEGLRARAGRHFHKTGDELYEFAAAQTFSIAQSTEDPARELEAQHASGSGSD